jgi:hypothetical protein
MSLILVLRVVFIFLALLCATATSFLLCAATSLLPALYLRATSSRPTLQHGIGAHVAVGNREHATLGVQERGDDP